MTDVNKYTAINLPDGLIRIGDEMFAGSTSLKEISISDSVTKIDDFLFADCTALTEISLPDGIKEIPWSCFSNCKSLKKVKLPASLESIGKEAFKDCVSLTELDIPEGVKIGKDAFLNGPVVNMKKKEEELPVLDVKSGFGRNMMIETDGKPVRFVGEALGMKVNWKSE